MSGSTRAALLCTYYQAYLDNQDSAAFIRDVSDRYLPGTLERLTAHALREVRRAAATALGFLGDYESNAVLGCCLCDEDRAVRTIAENGIRSLWRRFGSEADRQGLVHVIRLNTAGRYEEAIEAASELIEKQPACAEAWNQRAIAHYNLGHFSESTRDCRQTLELNPYHFDAATGMGQCYLQVSDSRSALECFRRALRLNSGLEGVRAGVEYLERSLKKKSGS